MAFGLSFSKSPSSDKTAYYDANSGDHTQHAEPDAVGKKSLAAKNGSVFVEGTECPIVPTRNSIRSKATPSGDSTQPNSSAKEAGGAPNRANEKVANGGNSKAKGKEPVTTAKNDMSGFTGIGRDTFFSVKAPPALTSSSTSSVETPTAIGNADGPTPRAGSPKPQTNNAVADAAFPAAAGAAVGGAAVQRRSTIKGTFADGAGTSGPHTTPEFDVAQKKRKETAEQGLDEGVVAKLGKGEAKEAKLLSKVIKNEARVEKKNLEVAIKELSKLQKVQREAANGEAKALAAHNDAIKAEQKASSRFLAAKTSQEQAQAEVRARLEGLQLARENAQNQTKLLQEKTKEVEEMRSLKALDDREREARLRVLAEVGKKRK